MLLAHSRPVVVSSASGVKSRGGIARSTTTCSKVRSLACAPSPAIRILRGVRVTASARGGDGGEGRHPKGAKSKRRRQRPPAPSRCAEPSVTASTVREDELSSLTVAGPVAGVEAVDGGGGEEGALAGAGGAAAAALTPGAGGGGRDDRAREVATVGVFVAALVASVVTAGGPEGAGREITRALDMLLSNHLPGVGGVVEDSFLGLLTVCTVYALWRSSLIPRPVGNPIVRKSRTRASWLHVASGGGALVLGLYGVVLERVYRESPGWTWMWVSSALFLTNALTYGPLMQIFKASKEGKYAMKLGYSFVASFQGVVIIAWSAQPDAPPWMYWAVMPFWYFSLAKLWESTDFVLALMPAAAAGSLAEKVAAGSKARLGRMTPDAATLTYVSLNALAAVFDNCYMALYTALGPEQFWHTSRTFDDADFHLRLVKGTTGSLTIALLIFISTLGWRKQMPMKVAVWLNVVLGSVGPWVVLFWHKLPDPSEDWFPQFVFDPAYHYLPLWQIAGGS